MVTWDIVFGQVRQEMVEEKGLAPDAADKIGGFVNGNAGGGKELWAKLDEHKTFGDHPVRPTGRAPVDCLLLVVIFESRIQYSTNSINL